MNSQFDPSFENGVFGTDLPPHKPYGLQPSEPPRTDAKLLLSPRRQVTSIALAITFITLFTTVVQLVLALIIRMFFPSIAEANWFLIVFSSSPMYLVAMPLSLLFFAMAPATAPQQSRIKLSAWFGLLAICFAMTYVGNIIGATVNELIAQLTGEPVENDLDTLTKNTPFWANLLFLGILAPILEELFYRKLVIDRLTAFGDFPAILLSGILFGMIHGNFGQFFYATLMGFVFGFIYLKTGKLRYSIALHMAVNLIGGVYTSEVLKYLDLEALAAAPLDYAAQNPTPILLFALYFCFLLLCFLTAPIALILLWKKIRFQKASQPVSATEWKRALLANPVVWILLLLVVLLFVL